MKINTGKKLVNLDKYAQVSIEATEWDTWQLIASNSDIEEETIVLGEYEKRSEAEEDFRAIVVELGKRHDVISLRDNWIPDEKGILGMDCMSM